MLGKIFVLAQLAMVLVLKVGVMAEDDYYEEEPQGAGLAEPPPPADLSCRLKLLGEKLYELNVKRRKELSDVNQLMLVLYASGTVTPMDEMNSRVQVCSPLLKCSIDDDCPWSCPTCYGAEKSPEKPKGLCVVMPTDISEEN